MKLDFIPLDKLVVSKTNMRHGRHAPDVTDILPTIRKRGVIQPVLVRPQSGPDPVDGDAPLIFEIIAGRRRFTAATLVAQERRAAGDAPLGADESLDMLPCAILDAGDDAAAIEASMIENMARLDALGHVAKTVLFVVVRGRPTAALTQRASGGRPAPRIAQRCLIAA